MPVSVGGLRWFDVGVFLLDLGAFSFGVFALECDLRVDAVVYVLSVGVDGWSCDEDWAGNEKAWGTLGPARLWLCVIGEEAAVLVTPLLPKDVYPADNWVDAGEVVLAVDWLLGSTVAAKNMDPYGPVPE